MSYDDKRNHYHLFQSIILQAEFKENEYDPDLCEDFQIKSSQLRGNGIGHEIYYLSQPDVDFYYIAHKNSMKNYILITPDFDVKFNTIYSKFVLPGEYLVLLGILTKNTNYSFNPQKSSTIRAEEYPGHPRVIYFNKVDLKIYTDINNDIKNPNVKERKIQSLENAKKEKYYDVGNETIEKKLYLN